MNGRPFNPGNSSSQKNLVFNNIRYVKPMYLLNQGQQQTRNLYYDNNPYFLNHNPLMNRAKGIYNTSKNSRNSRDLSETSSQKSGKVIRANGLRMAQKPRILKGGIQQRQPSLSQSRSNEQTRKLFDRNIQIEEQNRNLRQENNRLRENMRRMEQTHKKQVFMLNSKFQSLLVRAQELEHHVENQDSEWKRKMQQISHLKGHSHSQLNSNSSINGGGQTATSNQYYNAFMALNNPSGSNIKK